MPNVKTAISMEEPLFKEVDALAREMRLPRSQLFVKAVEDLPNALRGKRPDPAERDYRSRMRSHHRRIVEGQW